MVDDKPKEMPQTEEDKPKREGKSFHEAKEHAGAADKPKEMPQKEKGHDGEAAKHETKHPAHPPKQEEAAPKYSELSDKYLRISAEFDNCKKRMAKEKEEICRASEGKLMLRMIPAYEEIGLAEAEVAKLPESETRKGALLVLSKLRSQFENEGLQPMKLLGEKLDPFRHESALSEESDKPEGTIVRVIRQGYLYKGEVLQHALVSVSKGKAAEEKKE